MSIAEQLQRQHLAALTPYASARRSMSGDGVWLNANEAPYTPSITVDDTAQNTMLNRYPSFQSDSLNGAYAAYASVATEQVLSCRGSDEAIDLLIRSFCEPGRDGIMITTPTYGMYAISTQTQGAKVIDVPLIADADGDLQLNTEAMLAALENVKLVFICQPSNPLGNRINREALREFIDAVGCRALVVVDEAYIEFVDDSNQASAAQWLNDYPQLVVLRTLSKAFGLAAIRCGFALANKDIIDVLQKVIAPYPMPQPCLNAATAALSAPNIARMQALVAETKALRDDFVQWVSGKAWALKVWPSVTNFVLISVPDAAKLVSDCAANGVLIRNQSAQRGLNNTVRISIGSATEMQKLMEVLP